MAGVAAAGAGALCRRSRRGHRVGARAAVEIAPPPSTPPATDPTAPSTTRRRRTPRRRTAPTTVPAPTDRRRRSATPSTSATPSSPGPTTTSSGPPSPTSRRGGPSSIPALYGEELRAAQRWDLRRLPRAHDADPGLRHATSRRPTRRSCDYSAFYCAQGDFMVYDDGEQGALVQLADELGPSILAVVLAHEFGHAVQSRAGELDRGLPTIVTEQQADCFAGAWVRRRRTGEAPGLAFTDADVRTGLIGDDHRPRPRSAPTSSSRAATARPSTASARSRSASSTVRPLRRAARRPAAALDDRSSNDTGSRGTSRSATARANRRHHRRRPQRVLAAELATIGADAPGAGRSCRSDADRVVECADPAGDRRHGRRVLPVDRTSLLRRAAWPRPVRPLRRLRRRLPARQGVERSRPGGPRQPADRRGAGRSPATASPVRGSPS